MTITTQDIKLFASKVMSDVPEGGGGPTGTVLQSGKSNNIFRDVREQDRAGGNLSMRQVHLGITSGDTDVAMGCNLIISEPPTDPNVSVVLMATDNDFATRDVDIARLEAGFVAATSYPGVLMGDHIRGMRSLSIVQGVDASLPVPGDRLVLVYRNGVGLGSTQYVSVIKVEDQVRTYEDDRGKFERRVLTLQLGQALDRDYPGFEVTRYAVTDANLNANTRIRTTVWGNASKYYGVQPLTAAAALGDYTVQAASMYERLVPAAQAETPLLDVRTNGQQQGLVATGDAVSRSITQVFTTAASMYTGSPFMPGSLAITRDGITITDKAGTLVQGGTEVGQADYENGLLTLSTSVWGSAGGTHAVAYTPADLPQMLTRQRAIQVTGPSQSLTYAFVFEGAPPLPKTLVVSYLAQGRWYVLRDDGGGALRGQDAAWGVGSVDYETGAVLLSLGALPDIGSLILIQYQSDAQVSAIDADLFTWGPRLYAALNASGEASETPGGKTLAPGSVAIHWTDGGSKTATDDSIGGLTGDATGTVDYSAGVVRISPNTLPASGTVFMLDGNAGTPDVAAGVSINGGSLGAGNITPGTVQFDLGGTLGYAPGAYGADITRALSYRTKDITLAVADDTQGTLYAIDPGNNQRINLGTVDYSAGTIHITNLAPAVDKYDATGPSVIYTDGSESPWNTHRNAGARTRTLTITSTTVAVTYSNGLPSAHSVSIPVTQWQAQLQVIEPYRLQGVSFGVGDSRYQQTMAGALLRNIDSTTGAGLPAGTIVGGAGRIQVQAWPAGASPALQDVRGLLLPAGVGVALPGAAFSTYLRTAAAPLRPGSFSVLGTMQDGTTFNVTADNAGVINGTRVKGRVDVQYGFAELYFVDPNGDEEITVDLAHLGIAGVTTMPADMAMLDTLRYNAVAYEYIPVDPEIIGVNPVRLPSDGRVPIFQAGDYVVVHTQDALAAQTVTDNQLIDLGVERLTRITITGDDGAEITHGWARDLDAGTVHILTCDDWAQPVRIGWSIEHMAVVREAQISGQLTLNRACTHAFPLGKSFVSSALMLGDRYARVSRMFDQQTWDGITYADAPIGNVATATYNDAAAPVQVDNTGAITQRWALHFLTTTTVRVVGDKVGVVLASASIGADIAPINPNTGTPYFRLLQEGWGSGWAAGNLLRMDTVGAGSGFCIVRAVQPGDYTSLDHRFALLARVDIDRPGVGD